MLRLRHFLQRMLWISVLAAATAPAPLWSAVEGPPALPEGVTVEYHPLERQLLAEARRGRLDNRMLLRAALIANGVRDVEALAQHEAHFHELLARLKSEPDWNEQATARQRARVILEFLHREVLHGGYAIRCSNVAETLATGKYNCITATVLFNCLAGHLALEVRGGEAPGHVVSLLVEPHGTTRVETTCARWFNLLEDPRRRAAYAPPAAGRATRGARKIRRELNAAQLVATIYYNRGVDALDGRRFVPAVAANAKALQFDPQSITARGNLLAAVNNWALEQAAGGDYARALSTLDDGRRIAPQHEPFQVNTVVLRRKWAGRLAESGQFAEALDVLCRNDFDTQDGVLAADECDIYRRWLDQLARDGDSAGLLSLCRATVDRRPQRDDLREAELEALLSAAAELQKRRQHAKAIELLDCALRLDPGNALLRERRRTAEAARRSAQHQPQGGSPRLRRPGTAG